MSAKLIVLLCLSALVHFNTARDLSEESTSLGPGPSVTTEYPWIETGDGVTPDYHLLPSYEECGRAGSPDRILGGEKCNLGDFPWTALLQYRLNNGGYHDFLCGGTLINNRYILTAGHCVKGQVSRIGPLVSVRLGEYDISKMVDCVVNEGCNKGITIDVAVEEVIPHPKWEWGNSSHPNDIALIRLAEPVKFNNLIKPVCLPNRGNHFTTGRKLWIAGWGQTEIGKLSDIKLKVKIPTLPIKVCQDIYSKLDKSIRLNGKTQFCAGGERGKDSCQGDSGGPAMRTHIDEKTGEKVSIQDGIISFGPTPCGKQGMPGVYTRVVHHLDWILNTIRP